MIDKFRLYTDEIRDAENLDELISLEKEISTDHRIPIIIKDNLKNFLSKRSQEIKETWWNNQ